MAQHILKSCLETYPKEIIEQVKKKKKKGKKDSITLFTTASTIHVIINHLYKNQDEKNEFFVAFSSFKLILSTFLCLELFISFDIDGRILLTFSNVLITICFFSIKAWL